MLDSERQSVRRVVSKSLDEKVGVVRSLFVKIVRNFLDIIGNCRHLRVAMKIRDSREVWGTKHHPETFILPNLQPFEMAFGAIREHWTSIGQSRTYVGFIQCFFGFDTERAVLF